MQFHDTCWEDPVGVSIDQLSTVGTLELHGFVRYLAVVGVSGMLDEPFHAGFL